MRFTRRMLFRLGVRSSMLANILIEVFLAGFTLMSTISRLQRRIRKHKKLIEKETGQ